MLIFEWDKNKAKKNIKIHGISFGEASASFKDTLSLTIYDPLHSDEEDRFVTIGNSCKNRLLIIIHTVREIKIKIISARKATKKKGSDMKKMQKDPDMLEEYDFSNGVQGKYAEKFEEGTNVVVIDPDVAKFFPDHDSVNQALRSLTEIIKSQKSLTNQ